MIFFGDRFFHNVNELILKEMEEKKLDGKSFFQSQVSFNIDDDDEKEPVKRKRTKKHKAKRRAVEEIETQCPGCGNHIDSDDFLECIVNFTIGAHDHSVNDPVRTRFIQTLRNEIAALPTPRPNEAWVLEVAQRIEAQMSKLLDAERLRRGAEIENRLRVKLEAEIRQRLETEIWKQVEEGLAKDIAGDSEE